MPAAAPGAILRKEHDCLFVPKVNLLKHCALYRLLLLRILGVQDLGPDRPERDSYG